VSHRLRHFLFINVTSKTVSSLTLSFAAMKKLLSAFLFISFFCGCNNSDQDVSGKPENDLDAARTFIRNALDGKFEQARQLMLPDSTNDQTMNVTERNYERMSEANKVGYRNASIQIYNTRNVNDSTRIVTYSNSFKNQKDSLKLVQISGQWLVDLKFTFQEHGSNGH
jgi:hypothetical protein